MSNLITLQSKSPQKDMCVSQLEPGQLAQVTVGSAKGCFVLGTYPGKYQHVGYNGFGNGPNDFVNRVRLVEVGEELTVVER